MTEQFDLTSSEFAEDPFSLFEALRREEGLARAVDGWIASRHADVVALLADDRLTNRAPGMDEAAVANPSIGSLLALDPPDHTRIRAIVAAHFSPRAVDGFAATVNGVVEQRVAAFGDVTFPVELISELIAPVTTGVIAEFIGVPAAQRATLDEAIEFPVAAQQVRLCELAEQLIAEPRSRLVHDVVDAVSEGHMTHVEAVGLVGLLLFAGHETTTALIVNAVVMLHEHPDLHRQLRGDPALVRPFVSEVLRLDSPVQHLGRWAIEDFEYGDAHIEAGDLILLLPGSADRDAVAWSDADQVALDRTASSPHVAFGWGRHRCLGAAVARLEAEVALRALVDSFDTFTFVDPVSYRAPANVRCPRHLVVAAPA